VQHYAVVCLCLAHELFNYFAVLGRALPVRLCLFLLSCSLYLLHFAMSKSAATYDGFLVSFLAFYPESVSFLSRFACSLLLFDTYALFF
jgi:hypothetical protein